MNNAGVGHFAPVADMSAGDWQNVIDTNLSGVFYCSAAALPHLKRRGGGWIINISSLAGKNPFKGGAAYCASKAGLNAFSEALMQEVRYDNIRVSYIMPGSVATEFGGPGGMGAADWKIAPEDVADLVLELVTFPAAQPPELHRAAAVASEEVATPHRCRPSRTTTSSSGWVRVRSATCIGPAISSTAARSR